jgi:hypothetical protein
MHIFYLMCGPLTGDRIQPSLAQSDQKPIGGASARPQFQTQALNHLGVVPGQPFVERHMPTL